MKRIFPIITTLILLSLLGIIFFQVLWIQGGFESKQEQFEERISYASGIAAMALVEEKGNLSPFELKKKGETLFPSDRILDVEPPTITNKFSREEVRQIIRKAFEKSGLNNLRFEFAVTTSSMMADDIQSVNFFKLFEDTASNLRFQLPLVSPSGSASEGISPDEWLVIIVPHLTNIVWKQMSWMIVGAVVFTL
ncbi:MAG: hypothetical protein ABIQ56_07180, partial [Chitinophagaceae bacterium]